MFTTTESLLPNVIRRRQHRARPFATVVSIDGGVQHLSFSDLENASNRASWFLDEKIVDDKVFLYMGPNDIRYFIWVIAAMKTGKCVIFPSLANQIPANQQFFKTVGAKTLIYAPEAVNLLAPLLSATKGAVDHIPSPTYDELLHNDATQLYPFEKSFDDLKDTRFMGLHTSGTSGHPKPIYWNHMGVSTLPSFLDTSIRDRDGDGSNAMRDVFQGNNVLNPFPLYHFGSIGQTLWSTYCDNTLVFPTPGVRLSPENLTVILQKGKCTVATVPPSILEAMLSYPLGMDVLAGLKLVAYSGGPLNPARGEVLAKRLPHLCTVIASTEGGPAHVVSPVDSSHWDAFKFHDVGQRMDEVAPDIYELVYPRTELVNRTHAYFHIHPNHGVEYRTSDLFSPVEGQEGWWKYRGRADNWIAMSNGLKMDPTEMENTIASHPDITGVLVAGSYRFRLCLLIELREEVDLSLESVWPIIEAANKKVSKFGRVPKELVIFATPDKPFLRASKGTIQRRLTVQAYKEEIDRLYNEVEEGLLTGGIPLPSSTEPQGLMPFLTELCSQTLLDDTNDGSIDIDDNLLASGLDSLSVFVLLARLKAALRKYGIDAQRVQLIDNKLLYTATTVRQLAEQLSGVLSATETSNGPVEHSGDRVTTQLLEKYDAEIQRLAGGTVTRASERPDTEVVLLTGSTGSLGSHILSSLLARSDVRKVVCLNRNGDAKPQSASFKARGLPALPVDDGRVVFLKVKYTEPKFGLPDDVYATLARETTSIVHNAFPVNFLLSLPSFEPQFQSLLNLLRLAVDSRYSPAVLFVSSISAATLVSANSRQDIVPEEVLDSNQATHLLRQGYARSKYICERLLASYTSTLGRPSTVLRVGQVCGPFSGTGVWNASEWLPSLVLSSKFLGAIPDSLGSEVNWIPVDILGDIIAQIVCAAAPKRGDPAAFLVYNLVNPSITPWSELLSALEAVGPVATVSAAEWIDRLEKSDREHHIIHQNPAAKLIDFYKQTMLDVKPAAKVEISNLLRASETAANLPPVNKSHMSRWMRGWGL
ncbi:hypothetical protein F5X99DRAFT_229647 [Biscogniauxia marginata]|nr:hypothetical protein F5X99DRAFT_229647 [Biscogniauxia marginata]